MLISRAVCALGFSYYAPKDVVIPEGIVGVSGYAFADMKIQRVSFPSSVNSIGSHAFSGCSSLRSVIYEDSTKKDF